MKFDEVIEGISELIKSLDRSEKDEEIRNIAKGSITDERLTGYTILTVVPIFTLLVWVFGPSEFWSFSGKLILTFIALVVVYFMGYVKVRNANKELEELEL